MQLALRPYVSAAGVAVLGAGLIHVTPVAAPHVEQRAVQLAAAEALSDLVGPIDATVSSLGGLGAELSGVLPSLGDLSGTLADAASSMDTLELLDPAFWQQFWADLLNPDAGSSAWLMLTGALEQLPVIGPLMVGLGVVEFLLVLVSGGIWSEIAHALGIQPFAAAADGLGTGLQTLSDTALAGVIDPALPAGVTTGLADITALDPSALTSILDLNPIADIGAVVDAGTISDLGGVLASLIP